MIRPIELTINEPEYGGGRTMWVNPEYIISFRTRSYYNSPVTDIVLVNISIPICIKETPEQILEKINPTK